MNKSHKPSDNTHKMQLAADSPFASPQAKGERVKRIRHLANLSREELCTGCEINLATLISWEVGRFGGLSQKGAMRLIARVAKEGVFCTPDWLLFEVGAGPQVVADYKKVSQVDIKEQEQFPPKNFDESTVIVEELMMFRKLNKHAIDYIVDDDTMLPFYCVGDYVGGTKRLGDKVRALVGLDCILQTKDGRIVMRRLQAGPSANTYNLVGVNLLSSSKNAIIYDVEIHAAAPIIWHRRREPMFS